MDFYLCICLSIYLSMHPSKRKKKKCPPNELWLQLNQYRSFTGFNGGIQGWLGNVAGALLSNKINVRTLCNMPLRLFPDDAITLNTSCSLTLILSTFLPYFHCTVQHSSTRLNSFFSFPFAKVVDSTWYFFWYHLEWGSERGELAIKGEVKTL